LLSETDGSLLVGLGATGHHACLQRLQNGTSSAVIAQGFDGAVSGGGNLFRDRDGSLCLSPFDPGIVGLQDGKAERYTAVQGLSSDGIMQDSEGTVWVTTDKGVDSFSTLPVLTYSALEGKPSGPRESALGLHDGSVLLGTGQMVTLQAEITVFLNWVVVMDQWISSDHDPLYRFHQLRATLRFPQRAHAGLDGYTPDPTTDCGWARRCQCVSMATALSWAVQAESWEREFFQGASAAQSGIRHEKP
jgi:hypothetical protein